MFFWDNLGQEDSRSLRSWHIKGADGSVTRVVRRFLLHVHKFFGLNFFAGFCEKDTAHLGAFSVFGLDLPLLMLTTETLVPRGEGR